MSKIGISRMSAALMSICVLPLPVYADSPEDIVRRAAMEIGRRNVAGIIILLACLLTPWLVGPRGRKLILRPLVGLALLTFLAVQGRSVLYTYNSTWPYQVRKTMALSDLQLVDNLYDSRYFSGRNVLFLLVADYMPDAKVFLYDKNLYSRESLNWSGRDPGSTFVFGGYQSAMDASFKAACLGRPHIIYESRLNEMPGNAPLYIATPLSLYEKEEQVFLMKDAAMDYLIPGSWGAFQHE
jgi:hypothetical protein